MRFFASFVDRTPAGLPNGFLSSLARADSLQELRDRVTDAILADGGLAIARNDDAAICADDPLTPRQRSLAELVAGAGYRVKFRSVK
jgi:hypothetical protein